MNFIIKIHYLKKIISRGSAASLNQLGFCIKIAFSNWIAIQFAGKTGLTVFSTCLQTMSIMSIVIYGVLHAMTPIVSALHGMNDYHGIKLLMKTIIKIDILISVIFFVVLELFPMTIFVLYNVTDSNALALGIPALRIFSIMYLFRQTVLVFLYYYQTMGKNSYSAAISMFDGFIGIIIFALILCPFFGIYGLWMAYPCCSISLLAVIIVIGVMMKRISKEKYLGIFLIPSSYKNSFVDFSLVQKHMNISDFVKSVERFCINNGLDKKKASLAALACEEVCLYFDNTSSKMDVMVYINRGNIDINFHSIGAPMDILSAPRQRFGSIDVLLKIAKEVKYDYVIGMNETKVCI